MFGHPVELLVTDKTSFADTKEHWRAGEARERIAGRVRELVDSGEAEPGEIVVLFAAGTDAEQYEEALRREARVRRTLVVRPEIRKFVTDYIKNPPK